MSKIKLQQLLSRRLHLKDPEFIVRKVGSMLCGSVVSETFRGKSDHQRIRMIRDVVDEEFGPDADRLIGTLLAYTPDEWNIDAIIDEESIQKVGTAPSESRRNAPRRRSRNGHPARRA